MKRIFTKIFISYISVIILITIPIIYYSFNTIKDNYQKNLIQSQINLSHATLETVNPLIESHDYKKLDSVIKNLGNQIKSRITIIDKNGRVIADSKANPFKMDNHSDRPEVVQAIKSGIGTAIRHSYTINQDMIYVASQIKLNESIFGVIRLSIYMEDFSMLISNLEFQILQIILIAGCIILVLAFIFARSITKPITQMANTMTQVSSGDLTVRTDIHTNDELGVLSDGFNDMISKIELLFNQTKSQKDELDMIISSIQEGLVVIDKNGKISLCNDSFNRITGYSNVIDKYYWEVIRDSGSDKILKRMLGSELGLTEEIELKNEYYICSSNKINNDFEHVLIFYNITELKKLENIKKDFVVNVSHELRTPLTVIKGYIETIEDDVEEKHKKYISIIKNHTNRLINIVQDLLTISQIEENNIKLEIQDIDLNSLFSSFQSTFEQKLEQKGMQLNCEIDPAIINFKGDAFKLEQMFINLIDNAIKYSDKGLIRISAHQEADHIRFEVIDTGVGIPKQDQDRVFERFYTVDKSRSRQLAGTGLGLSIVKHIVSLHKGKISLESEIDKGSKFTILIPNII